jgi:four helix bundle protein
MEYKRFLEIAMGSLFELETLLIIINEIYFNTSQSRINGVIEFVHVEQKMLNNLITRLKANN